MFLPSDFPIGKFLNSLNLELEIWNLELLCCILFTFFSNFCGFVCSGVNQNTVFQLDGFSFFHDSRFIVGWPAHQCWGEETVVAGKPGRRIPVVGLAAGSWQNSFYFKIFIAGGLANACQ